MNENDIFTFESTYSSDYKTHPRECICPAEPANSPSARRNSIQYTAPIEVKKQEFMDVETLFKFDPKSYLPFNTLWTPKEIIRTNPKDHFINPYCDSPEKSEEEEATVVDIPCKSLISPAVCINDLYPAPRAELCSKIYQSMWTARGEPKTPITDKTTCYDVKSKQFVTTIERKANPVSLEQNYGIPITPGWQQFAANWDALQMRASGVDPTREFWLRKGPDVTFEPGHDPYEKLKDPKVSNEIRILLSKDMLRAPHDKMIPGYGGYAPDLARGVNLEKKIHGKLDPLVTTYDLMTRDIIPKGDRLEMEPLPIDPNVRVVDCEKFDKLPVYQSPV